MKLTIFGASGATGRHLVEQALQAGHEVTAFIRASGGLEIQHRRLRTVAGDFDQPSAVLAAIEGAHAVVSVLGARKNDASGVCARGIACILRAMDGAGARRLIALSSYGASETSRASLFIRFVRKVIPDKMRDKDEMEALVRGSAIDWTLIRPPLLTNGQRTGRYRAGTALAPGLAARLSRADLAAFILRVAEGGRYIGEAPVVFS
jgi:putative NADH-flavin reductase